MRLLSDDDRRSLFASFPMLLEEEPFDSPLLEYRAVSVWNHWLHLSGETHLIEVASPAERRRWAEMFEALDRAIVYGTPHLFVRWSTGACVVGVEDDVERARERTMPGRAFVLLLPALGVFYTSGDNDPHTRVTYRLSEPRAEPFDTWVRQSGLEYVREYQSCGASP